MARATHSLVPPAAAQALQPLSHAAPRAPGCWALSQTSHPGAAETLRWGLILWVQSLHTPSFRRPSWQPRGHIQLTLMPQRWCLWRSIPCDPAHPSEGGGWRLPTGGPFRSTHTRQQQGRVSRGPGGGEGGVPSHPTVPEGRASRDNILPEVPGVLPVSWLSPIFARFYLWLEGTRQRSPLPRPLPVFYNLTLLSGDLECTGWPWRGWGVGSPWWCSHSHHHLWRKCHTPGLRGSRALPGRMFPDEQLCCCLTSWFCRWKLMLGAEIEAQGPPGFAHSGMWRGHPGLTCLSQLRRSHRPRCPRAGRGCGQPTRLLVRCRRPSLTCAQRAPSRPWRSRWKAPL